MTTRLEKQRLAEKVGFFSYGAPHALYSFGINKDFTTKARLAQWLERGTFMTS